MGYVKIVGHKTPGSEAGGLIITDKDGERRELLVGTVQEVSADEKKLLEANGYHVEDSSKEGFEEAQGQPPVASDVVGSAPVLGNVSGEDTDQSTAKSGGDKNSNK